VCTRDSDCGLEICVCADKGCSARELFTDTSIKVPLTGCVSREYAIRWGLLR
jgi:hypothetical protein